jgi:hypothetical protein
MLRSDVREPLDTQFSELFEIISSMRVRSVEDAADESSPNAAHPTGQSHAPRTRAAPARDPSPERSS